MSTELGRLACYLCEEEFDMGDSVRFIRFDVTTQMFHTSCREVIQEMIEEKRRAIHETDNEQSSI